MRKTFRLGGRLDPADGKVSRVEAQSIFLNTINEIAPVVFQDLQGRPLQSFIDAGLHQQPFHAQHRVYEWLQCGAHRLLEPRAVELYSGLTEWAKKYHIEARWVLERAYWSLVEWQLCPPEERRWSLAFDSYVGSLPPDPPMGLNPYRSRLESRANYLKYVAGEIMRQIEMNPLLSLAHNKSRAGIVTSIVRSKAVVSYCQAVEKLARRDGYKEPPARPQLLEHMKWTVRVRVRGQGWDELSEELELEPRSIQKAVKDTIQLINLPLAPTFKEGRGRPPGKRDVKHRHVARP